MIDMKRARTEFDRYLEQLRTGHHGSCTLWCGTLVWVGKNLDPLFGVSDRWDKIIRETFQIIKENILVNRIIDRIPYSNPDTRGKMERIRQLVNEYIDQYVN